MDFTGSCKLVDEMTDDEYVIAMDAFYRARTDHYTDAETGQIVFEPHEDEGGDAGPDDVLVGD